MAQLVLDSREDMKKLKLEYQIITQGNRNFIISMSTSLFIDKSEISDEEMDILITEEINSKLDSNIVLINYPNLGNNITSSLASLIFEKYIRVE